MGPSDLGCGVAASVCQASLSALLRHGRRGSPGKLAAPPGGRALSQRFIEPALAMSRCALPGPEPIQALLPGTSGDSLDIVPVKGASDLNAPIGCDYSALSVRV